MMIGVMRREEKLGVRRYCGKRIEDCNRSCEKRREDEKMEIGILWEKG